MDGFDADEFLNERTTLLPESSEVFRLDRLFGLAGCLGSDIAVYDLEMSAPRNAWNFGVMEVAVLTVKPDGRAEFVSFLLDPRCPLDPESSECTGITDKMLAGRPSWDEAGAPLFERLSRSGARLAGYGNAGVDRKCVADLNTRYRLSSPMVPDDREMDVFPAARRRFGRRVTLEHAFRALEPPVTVRRFHRAGADALACAGVADALIGHFGEQEFLRLATVRPASAQASRAGRYFGWVL